MSFMSLSRGHWFEPQPTSTSAPSPWSPRIYTYNIKVFSLQHKGFTVRKSKIYQQKNYNLLLKHPEFAIKTPMIYNTQDMPLNRFTSSTKCSIAIPFSADDCKIYDICLTLSNWKWKKHKNYLFNSSEWISLFES